MGLDQQEYRLNAIFKSFNILNKRILPNIRAINNNLVSIYYSNWEDKNYSENITIKYMFYNKYLVTVTFKPYEDKDLFANVVYFGRSKALSMSCRPYEVHVSDELINLLEEVAMKKDNNG